MNPLDGLTFFFPAYDEESNVDACIDACTDVAGRLAIARWEILFVDDGSSDGTAHAIARRAASESRIRLVRHGANLGYGAAVRTGIREARYPWFFMTDADLQFRLDELSRLLPHAARATFVQGFRENRADRASRVVLGRLYRGFVHALLDVRVRDPECSFRLVRTDLLRSLEVTTRGPMVPVELVVRAAERGAVFAEVGVSHHPRVHGRSNALTLRTVAMLSRDLLRLATRADRR